MDSVTIVKKKEKLVFFGPKRNRGRPRKPVVEKPVVEKPKKLVFFGPKRYRGRPRKPKVIKPKRIPKGKVAPSKEMKSMYNSKYRSSDKGRKAHQIGSSKYRDFIRERFRIFNISPDVFS